MQPDADPDHPSPGMHLWGWMSPTELDWLHATAATMSSVVEIGCLHGRSAYALATGCAGPVYCIDPWSDDGWRSFTASMGHLPNVHAIREASPAAAARVPGQVEMTFLDGDHTADAVRADIECWLPRTTRLLCGHDYVPFSALPAGTNPGFPDVAIVVDEVFGDRVRVAPDTAIWCVDLGESSP